MTDSPPSGPSAVLSRFTPVELVTGGGCLAFFVGLLLPWMSFQGALPVHAWSGIGFVTILAWIAATAWFAVRSPWLRGTVNVSRRNVSDAVVFITAGLVEIVTIIVFYSQHHTVDSLDRSVNIGWVLALLGGLATALGGALVRLMPAYDEPRAAPRTLHEEPAAPSLHATEPDADPAATPPRVTPPAERGTTAPTDGPGIV